MCTSWKTVVRLGSKTDKSIFSADTLLLPSSEGIISEVRDNPNAIGYDGLGYVTPEVKVLAVAKRAGEAYVLPSVDTVNNGDYPISRDLYMYIHADASQAISDYLAWIIAAGSAGDRERAGVRAGGDGTKVDETMGRREMS